MDSLKVRKFVYNELNQLNSNIVCSLEKTNLLVLCLYFNKKIEIVEKESPDLFLIHNWFSSLDNDYLKSYYGIKANIAIQELGFFLYLNSSKEGFSNIENVFNYYLKLYLTRNQGNINLNELI